jgi:hypothetical protein
VCVCACGGGVLGEQWETVHFKVGYKVLPAF